MEIRTNDETNIETTATIPAVKKTPVWKKIVIGVAIGIIVILVTYGLSKVLFK